MRVGKYDLSVGKCFVSGHRNDHKKVRFYNDEYVIGTCVFGYYAEAFKCWEEA